MEAINLLAFVACVFLIYQSYYFARFWWMMIRCYLLTKFGFVKDVKKYGEWAVVTGATDGIGKQYARQLAKQGLKIVLISRTQAKLESVRKEIEEEFHVETKVITFDFTQTVGYEKIQAALSDLDIGILVNNVGTADNKIAPFIEKDVNHLIDVVNCNVTSDVHMTHMVMTGMTKRKWGLVIHISSGIMLFDLKGLNLPVYKATKAFMSKFCNAVQLESNGVIDHQLVTPFVVSTNIAPVKHTLLSPSAEDFVKSAIRTIGISDDTCGYWSHEIQKVMCQNLPKCVTDAMMLMQFFCTIDPKYLEKQKER